MISAKYLLFEGDHSQKVDQFEQRFANYIGVKNAVMVPSARYGFYLLLKAFGVADEASDHIAHNQRLISVAALFSTRFVIPFFNYYCIKLIEYVKSEIARHFSSAPPPRGTKA